MKKLLTLIFTISFLTATLLLIPGCKSTKQKEAAGEGLEAQAMETDEVTGANEEIETAVLGGGCFWSMEAIFSQLKGVTDAEAGYAGGSKENPTYEEIHGSGHAEVVKITFDPEIISYRQLLEVFFYVHDPTTLNRQGNDVGEQYRSIILYTSAGQEKTAREFINKLESDKAYPDPIVTEVEPLDKYYSAEDYHQEYYENNSNQAYCALVILPKIEKFQDKFADLLK